MNRLPFSLPEFNRIVWASERAKTVWQPRIGAVNHVWQRIERASVVAKMRLGGLQNVSPEGLLELQDWCFQNDISYAILNREGASGTYSNASHPVKPGKPWLYRVYFGFSPREFLDHWKNGDERAIGEFLGYPQCCTEFFSRYWKDEGWRDLTYPMFKNTQRTRGPFECNILLRHLGVRAVFHLPCSFVCTSTCKIADDILSYRSMGYEHEISWIIEMLNWPVKWSSLHGVAITTTPVVKIISSSDALDEKVELERDGIPPEEASRGTEFPYAPVSLTLKDNWTDNGFKSYFSMKRAHELIIGGIKNIPSGEGKIIDLGCGNGALLERIVRNIPELVPYGVESDQKKFARVEIGDAYFEDIYNHKTYLNREYKIALISLNRFFEAEPVEVDLLLEALRKHVKYLIVYSYEPWKYNLDPVLYRNFSLLHCELDGSSEVRILRPNENPVL